MVAGVGTPDLARTYLRSAYEYARDTRSATLAATASYRLSQLPTPAKKYQTADGTRRGREITDADVAADLDDLPLLDAGRRPLRAFEDSIARLSPGGIPRLRPPASPPRPADGLKSSEYYLRLANRLTDDASGAGLTINYLATFSPTVRGGGAPPPAAHPIDLTSDSQALRGQADKQARTGLAAAQKIADPGLRDELVGRLVEAALDAGGGADADLTPGGSHPRCNPQGARPARLFRSARGSPGVAGRRQTAGAIEPAGGRLRRGPTDAAEPDGRLVSHVVAGGLAAQP